MPTPFNKAERDRQDREAENFENELKNMRIRAAEERQRLAEKTDAEKVQLEERQKEVEAGLGRRIKAAENAKRKVGESLMDDKKGNAEQLDQMRSRNDLELRSLQETRNRAVIQGQEDRVIQQARLGALGAIQAQSNARIQAAYNKDTELRHKGKIINNVKKEDWSLYGNSNKLVEKVGSVSLQRKEPSRAILAIIDGWITKCEANLTEISEKLNSSDFEALDNLDHQRKEMAEKCMELMEVVRSIIEEWAAATLNMSDKFPAGEVFKIIEANYLPWHEKIRELHYLIQDIPLLQDESETFNAVVASNCAAIANTSIDEEAWRRRIEAKKPAAGQSTIKY